MKVSVGQFNSNKTFWYLSPILKDWSKELILRLNSINKFGFGVHDVLRVTTQPLMYILIDKAHKIQRSGPFLEWIRTDDAYVHDYQYGSNLESRFHMIILAIPKTDRAQRAYTHFMLGQYSQMYLPEDITDFFSPTNPALKVLKKLPGGYETYCEEMKRILSQDISTLSPFSELRELALPPLVKEEIFNSELLSHPKVFIEGLESLEQLTI